MTDAIGSAQPARCEKQNQNTVAISEGAGAYAGRPDAARLELHVVEQCGAFKCGVLLLI